MSKFYKSKTIYEPIYDMYLMLIASNDRPKLVKKDDVDLLDDYGMTSKTPKRVKGVSKRGYTIVLCLDDDSTIHEMIDTITHECDHASGYIMQDIGEEPTWESEPKAYLSGYIAKNMSLLVFNNMKLVLRTK